MLDRSDVEKKLSSLEIPTLPEIMGRILDISADERASAEDLTAILQCDHAISARVLRVANSAFFGMRGKVDSLKRAVTLIGFETVRFIALATSVVNLMPHDNANIINVRQFWIHALGSARGMELLGKILPGAISREACYTGALLHDMGISLLALEYPKEYQAVMERAAESGRDIFEVERECLGFDHMDIGARVAGFWHLPPLIVEIIRHSHAPTEALETLPLEYSAVILASELADMAGFGFDWASRNRGRMEIMGKLLGLSPAAVENVLQSLSEMQDDTMELLDLIAPGL